MIIDAMYQNLNTTQRNDWCLSELLKHTLDVMHFVKQNHTEGDLDQIEFDIVMRWLQKRVAEIVDTMRKDLAEVSKRGSCSSDGDAEL